MRSPPKSAEKGWHGAFRDAEEVDAAGFPALRQLQPPLLQSFHVREGRSSAGGAGGMLGGWQAGGLAGDGPAPLWRLLAAAATRRGTGRAGRGSGGQVCCGVGPGRLLGWLQWSRKGRQTGGELKKPWRGHASSQAPAWPWAWARLQPRPGGGPRRGGPGPSAPCGLEGMPGRRREGFSQSIRDSGREPRDRNWEQERESLGPGAPLMKDA